MERSRRQFIGDILGICAAPQLFLPRLPDRYVWRGSLVVPEPLDLQEYFRLFYAVASHLKATGQLNADGTIGPNFDPAAI